LQRSSITQFLPSIGAIVAAVIVWQAAVALLSIPAYLLPSPSDIFATLVSSNIDWATNTWVTFYESALGFLLSAAIGVPLSIAMVYSTWLNKTLSPLILAMQIVPKVAIAPILVILFGFGDLPRVLVAFLVAFFPVIIDTTAGLNALDPDYIDLLRSLGSSEVQTFLIARIPNALPSILNGFKVSITLALIGAIVAEFVQANNGLGYILLTSLLQLGTRIAFASLLLLTVMGFGLYLILLLVERFTIPWYVHSKQVRV